MTEEFIVSGNMKMMYDFFSLSREDFLKTYEEVSASDYEVNYILALRPEFMADLMRRAENLLIQENSDYFEPDEDYITGEQWKVAISNFVELCFDIGMRREFDSLCYAMGC